ncbi:DUF6531 domain-containing protein, partial [Parachitinimonas caeni]
MVAIVTGQGQGLLDTSLNTLGGRSVLGQSASGQGGDQIYVNAANGNLVIQRVDEVLKGIGPDAEVVRTYNSQGQMAGGNGLDHGWMFGFNRRLESETVNNELVWYRIDGDGNRSQYNKNGECAAGGGAYDTLIKKADGNWEWTDGDTGTKEYYEGSNYRLSRIEYADGRKLTLEYRSDGLLSEVKADRKAAATENAVIRFGYDGSNQLTSIRIVNAKAADDKLNLRDGKGEDLARHVGTDYALDGNSVRITTHWQEAGVTKGYTTRYTYSDGRISQITQPDGSELSIAYYNDAHHRVRYILEQTQLGKRYTHFAYDNDGLTRTWISDSELDTPTSAAATTELKYSATGQLASITQPQVDGRRSQVTYEYSTDGRNDLVKVTVLPDSSQSTKDGVTTFYAGHAAGYGNWTQQTDSQGNVIATREYDPTSHLLQSETVYGNPVKPDQLASASGQTTRYFYDNQRHLRFLLTPAGRLTQYTYENGLRRSEIQYGAPLAVETVARLGEWARNQTTTSDGDLGMATKVESQYEYDDLGQLKSRQVGGVTTSYVYDLAGRLVQSWAGNGEKTTYTYDGLGRLLTSKTGTTLTTRHYSGDDTKVASGLVVQITVTDELQKADGKAKTVRKTIETYDRAGELVSRVEVSDLKLDGEDGAKTSYAYDTQGRLRVVGDATGVYTGVFYNAAGLKCAEVDQTGAFVEYHYNANNQLAYTYRYATRLTAEQMGKLYQAGTPILLDLDIEGLQAKGVVPPASVDDRLDLVFYDQRGRAAITVDADGYATETVYDGTGAVLKTIRYGIPYLPLYLLENGATKPRTDGDAGKQRDQLRAYTNLSAQSVMEFFRNQKELIDPDSDTKKTIPTLPDRITRYFTDADGLRTGQLDAEGYLTEYQYDGAGRKIETIRYATQIKGATDSS